MGLAVDEPLPALPGGEPMTRRLPPVEPCTCPACVALSTAIDLDLAARLRVQEAAELVDLRHGLVRRRQSSGPDVGPFSSPASPATGCTTAPPPAAAGPEVQP